jgi:hypothetical protein
VTPDAPPAAHDAPTFATPTGCVTDADIGAGQWVPPAPNTSFRRMADPVSLLVTGTATVTGVFTGVAALSFTARGAVGSSSDTGRESTLLTSIGSAVALLVVVLIVSTPFAGATNDELQITDAPAANGLGAALGEQVCVVPGGNPDNAHVTPTAGLGPKFVQVPLTVTGSPAEALAGAVVTACMSAHGTAPADCCATLLAGSGSGVVELAVPTTVTPPVTGAVKLT